MMLIELWLQGDPDMLVERGRCRTGDLKRRSPGGALALAIVRQFNADGGHRLLLRR